MSDDKYINDSQQRILKLVLCMAGNEIEGLSPTEVARLNECSPSQVTRDLANLKALGLAEQVPVTGRWRLGPQIVQVAIRHMTALERAELRLAETRNRFSRTD
jgi:DNA-binding IclR family transcriptional regulator